MPQIIDARGLKCPQPVVLTRKAMGMHDRIEVLVDNETSKNNVMTMARGAGWEVKFEKEENSYRLFLVKKTSAGPAETLAAAEQPSTCVFLTDDGVGSGPDELRVALMKAFISTLKEMSPLPIGIVLMTNGVKLICAGSPVIEDLEYLESAGVRVLACGTCLDYLGLMDKVKTGKVSNMYEITGTLLRAGNVVKM